MGSFFSKLDLAMAYHQVELHPESREITTFAGPDGLYRYKCLLFGVNMASEKFQQIISQVIQGCAGAYNMSDDIVVIKAPVMAYYSSEKATRLTMDASPVGLGAILEQEQEDGTWRPVYFASRRTTPVESRYSQFEREALGVYWACHKFHLYLIGIEFEIRTDHKALVKVLGPRSTPPSARLERWLLYLQQYTYTVSHIPGKANRADALSRLPRMTITADGEDTATEGYVSSRHE